MTTTENKVLTVEQVAERFNLLAQREKWFEIQDEFFTDDVKSVEPPDSPYMPSAEGRTNVRKKAETFIATIEAVHGASTSSPLVCGNHFAVGRELEVTVKNHGRIQMKQIMLYEVRDGKIISEQFFY